MKIYTNDRMEIKAVNQTGDDTLTGYELTEDSVFENWSESKICCYKVGLTPETITEIIGTKEETYTDLEGNEQTHTVDVTETKETGKWIVIMFTPYVDSRLIEHFNNLGIKTEENALSIIQTDEGLMESYEKSIENEIAIEDCNNALMELYEMIAGGEIDG